MASPAQQQSWRTELARRQNAIPIRGTINSEELSSTKPLIARRHPLRPANQEESEKKPAEKPIAKKTRMITLRLVQILATSGFATFGISWIGLMGYTLIKDLLQSNNLADPGDLIFFFMPPSEIDKLPDSIKSMPRLLSRLFIYPLGLIILLIYISIIVFIIILFAA